MAITVTRTAHDFLETVLKRPTSLEVKRVDRHKDLSNLFKARHDSYVSSGLIDEQFCSLFFDAFDFTENSRHLAVYQKQQLIAAVRLHLVRSDRDTSLCLEAFPEIRDQSDLISGGLIEYTRLIAGSTSLLNSIYSKFLLFEHSFRMAMKDGYRFAIAPVKSKHVGFYKKL